jgi:hypothetical protein
VFADKEVSLNSVSKILRNKYKYLDPNDGSRGPTKRSKGSFRAIEQTLSNWARNAQRSGTHITDDMIEEKARFFVNTMSNSDILDKNDSGSWLAYFKQKHRLAGKFDVLLASTNGVSPVSPVSPNGVPSPLPPSLTRSHESLKTNGTGSFIDFATAGYQLYRTQI